MSNFLDCEGMDEFPIIFTIGKDYMAKWYEGKVSLLLDDIWSDADNFISDNDVEEKAWRLALRKLHSLIDEDFLESLPDYITVHKQEVFDDYWD